MSARVNRNAAGVGSYSVTYVGGGLCIAIALVLGAVGTTIGSVALHKVNNPTTTAVSFDDAALTEAVASVEARLHTFESTSGSKSAKFSADVAALRSSVRGVRSTPSVALASSHDTELRGRLATLSTHVDATDVEFAALKHATVELAHALHHLQHQHMSDDDDDDDDDDDSDLKCAKRSCDPFVFGAMGDMAYTRETEIQLDLMVDSINANESGLIDFFVHVGDIMAEQQCNHSEYDRVLAELNRLEFPLVYTPGDNEWLDCTQRMVGSVDPYEALARVRSTFFPVNARGKAVTLGSPQRRVVRQSDYGFVPILAGYDARDYIENQRWAHNTLVFATFHLVGGNDGCTIELGDGVLSGSTLNIPTSCKPEYQRRSRANADWITRAFDTAIECDAPALVLLTHRAQTFGSIVDAVQGSCVDNADANCALTEVERIALYEGLARFNRPVLRVNGDGHSFSINTRGLPDLLTAVEVPGAPDTGYVRISVDPTSESVFTSIELGYCQKSPDTISLNCDDLSDLTNKIVTSDEELPEGDICNDDQPRICESLGANVLNDAMRAFSASTFAHYNAGGLNAALTCNPGDSPRDVCSASVGAVPPYNVTDGSTIETLRFQNVMRKFTISGAEIKEWLEVSVESMPASSGSYGHWSGLCFEYNIADPSGSRVQRAVLTNASNACGSTEIDLGSNDKTFTLLANEFIASGGGGYPTDPTREFLPFGTMDVTRDYQAVFEHFAANPGDISPLPQCRNKCISTTPLVECPEVLPGYLAAFDTACAAWE